MNECWPSRSSSFLRSTLCSELWSWQGEGDRRTVATGKSACFDVETLVEIDGAKVGPTRSHVALRNVRIERSKSSQTTSASSDSSSSFGSSSEFELALVFEKPGRYTLPILDITRIRCKYLHQGKASIEARDSLFILRGASQIELERLLEVVRDVKVVKILAGSRLCTACKEKGELKKKRKQKRELQLQQPPTDSEPTSWLDGDCQATKKQKLKVVDCVFRKKPLPSLVDTDQEQVYCIRDLLKGKGHGSLTLGKMGMPVFEGSDSLPIQSDDEVYHNATSQEDISSEHSSMFYDCERQEKSTFEDEIGYVVGKQSAFKDEIGYVAPILAMPDNTALVVEKPPRLDRRKSSGKRNGGEGLRAVGAMEEKENLDVFADEDVEKIGDDTVKRFAEIRGMNEVMRKVHEEQRRVKEEKTRKDERRKFEMDERRESEEREKMVQRKETLRKLLEQERKWKDEWEAKKEERRWKEEEDERKVKVEEERLNKSLERRLHVEDRLRKEEKKEEERRKEEQRRKRFMEVRFQEEEKRRKDEEDRLQKEEKRKEEERRRRLIEIRLQEDEKRRKDEEDKRIKELKQREGERKLQEQKLREEKLREEEQKLREQERKLQEQKLREEKLREEEQKLREQERKLQEQKLREEKLREQERKLQEQKLREEKLREQDRKLKEQKLREEKLREQERKLQEQKLREEKLREQERKLQEQKLREEKLREQERKLQEQKLREEERKLQEQKKREEQRKSQDENMKEEEYKRAKEVERRLLELKKSEEEDKQFREVLRKLQEQIEEQLQEPEKRDEEKTQEEDRQRSREHEELRNFQGSVKTTNRLSDRVRRSRSLAEARMSPKEIRKILEEQLDRLDPWKLDEDMKRWRSEEIDRLAKEDSWAMPDQERSILEGQRKRAEELMKMSQRLNGKASDRMKDDAEKRSAGGRTEGTKGQTYVYPEVIGTRDNSEFQNRCSQDRTFLDHLFGSWGNQNPSLNSEGLGKGRESFKSTETFLKPDRLQQEEQRKAELERKKAEKAADVERKRRAQERMKAAKLETKRLEKLLKEAQRRANADERQRQHQKAQELARQKTAASSGFSRAHYLTYRQYEDAWNVLKTSGQQSFLAYADIPWPPPSNPLFIEEGDSLSAQRRKLRIALLRWHPDKFQSLCGNRLSPLDKESMEARAKTVAQEVIVWKSKVDNTS